MQLICSLAKTKFPKFPTANWTRTTICIAASVGAQAFAWVLVLPPGEALLLLFSDKLICISVTPPASSQPLSPPCCLSADCQKFIYLTPKKLTQTPVRRTTAYPGTAPLHTLSRLGAWLVTRNEIRFICLPQNWITIEL